MKALAWSPSGRNICCSYRVPPNWLFSWYVAGGRSSSGCFCRAQLLIHDSFFSFCSQLLLWKCKKGRRRYDFSNRWASGFISDVRVTIANWADTYSWMCIIKAGRHLWSFAYLGACSGELPLCYKFTIVRKVSTAPCLQYRLNAGRRMLAWFLFSEQLYFGSLEVVMVNYFLQNPGDGPLTELVCFAGWRTLYNGSPYFDRMVVVMGHTLVTGFYGWLHA